MTDAPRYNYTVEDVQSFLEAELREIERSDPALYAEIVRKGRAYKRLIEQNPHPTHITAPNPAWQAWMDEHTE